MVPSSDIHLVPAKLTALRPTQMTVDYREVTEKRDHWKTLGKKARGEAIAAYWFPAVLGPEQRSYIVDHHHLGLALLEEGVEEVKVMLPKDLSWLDNTIFCKRQFRPILFLLALRFQMSQNYRLPTNDFANFLYVK